MSKSRAMSLSAMTIALALLSACTAPQPGQSINDPYEESNRRSHEVNKTLDTAILRPVALSYGRVVPAPARQGVSNVADNLSLPNAMVNGVLQAKPEVVVTNGLRFVINTTVGLGGLLDPAAQMGLYKMDADFGATLHRWGVREGAYVEAPLIGPSTERDLAGVIVDSFLDPLGTVIAPADRPIRTAVNVGGGLDKRYRFDQTLSSILYDSADSYGQAQLLYLQNRRFELGDTGTDAESPYDDPYEDPYAQ